MPGYGIVGPDDGVGLLPWAWAEERLTTSRNFWLSTRWPDGRPHVMPVWAIWNEGALWFSSSKQSRKARNLAADPRCVLTTEDSMNPVVLEGAAELLTSQADLDRYRLPHPLLGKLTVREMLFFTVYHNYHHVRSVADRLAAGQGQPSGALA